MINFKEIKVLLKGKSGKKLTAFSVIIFLLVTVIVFFTAYEFCRNIHLSQMNQYLRDIPKIIERRENDLLMRSRVYEDDILSRADLGLMLYGKNDDLSDAELLEQIRGTVSADSVSLLDGQRKLLSTTGPVTPEESFLACIKELEPREPRMEFVSAASQDGQETEEYDSKGFVLIPVTGSTNRSLVFEFSSDRMTDLYNTVADLSGVFERLISGGETNAFAKIDGNVSIFQQEDSAPDQVQQLEEDLNDVFEDSGKFRSRWNGTLSKLITLLGDRYLAALIHLPEEDTDILLTDPLKNVIRSGIFLAVTVSLFIGWGMVLLQIYIFISLRRKDDGKNAGKISRKWVCRETWPGILVMLLVTIIFTVMLLMLENRTIAISTAVARRESIQYEIDMRKKQEKTVRSIFVDFYRSRARMLADFLTEHPDQQTREGLNELSRIAGTDYLMLFDSTGEEILASNSYTGFSVGKNLSEDYQAVLLGYPYAVVGPEADPYTGRMQLGTAILMTDSEDQPDGFLLAVYSAGDLNDELKRMSYENTVNSFSVETDHIAAAISDGDGLFIAHTNPAMIGQKAADFLPDVDPGSNFEGYTTYDEKDVYVSASSVDGKTLLYIVPERGDSYVETNMFLISLAVLLVLALLYYPNAGLLIAQAMTENGKLSSDNASGTAIGVFPDGYSVFMTLFALFTMIAAYKGWWTSFVYVFSGNWSRGVHLFSLWAALLVTAVVLFFEFLIRTVVNFLENRLSLRAKTVTRMADSLIVYVVRFFLIFFIAYLFGVNTAALLASAGVISIAVGMGAKSLAGDLLDGFFMMLDGTIHVGDYVRVSGVTGTVTNMGIRTTEITDDEGNVVVLNNSRVAGVCNMSRNKTQQDQEKDSKKAS